MATIVLAEDDGDLRGVYATYLRSVGFEILEAAHGQQALDLVRTHRPALLLLDIWMPVLNGFEVLDGLRHDPAAGHTKVIMLSCQSDADARLECFGVGATEYLVKGMPLAELRAHVERCLAAAQAEPDPDTGTESHAAPGSW
ncbi:MAG TPA: response regulator [Isosphaeraceae bacterium]|nr:response regulator [Isosphaeraceae bacterium]